MLCQWQTSCNIQLLPNRKTKQTAMSSTDSSNATRTKLAVRSLAGPGALASVRPTSAARSVTRWSVRAVELAWDHAAAAVIAFALLWFLPAAPAQAAQRSAPAASQGALLYHNYCSVCHGDKGDGKSRASAALSTVPRDFTSAASKRELTRERIVLAITHGRPGTAMVAWQSQLSPADIGALADHVLSQFVQPHSAAAVGAASAAISGTRAHGGREADALAASNRADRNARLPDGLNGDARRGAAFYRANCVACHGVQGDGAGPRAYFINPRPRNFTDADTQARYNRPALYAGVAQGRVGSEMPAWSKVASPQQIADVSEYVFQTFITPRAGPAKPGSAAGPLRP